MYPSDVSAKRGGIEKTSPRQVPARAPACLKLNYDDLARRPQPMPSTHTFRVFSCRHVVGAMITAPWRRWVHNYPANVVSGMYVVSDMYLPGAKYILSSAPF